jgi:hypothetical protein
MLTTCAIYRAAQVLRQHVPRIKLKAPMKDDSKWYGIGSDVDSEGEYTHEMRPRDPSQRGRPFQHGGKGVPVSIEGIAARQGNPGIVCTYTL